MVGRSFLALILSLVVTASGFAGAPSTPAEVHTFQVDPYAPAMGKTFEVVPGKQSPWSFTLEPYGWLPGLTGDVGLKGYPATHIDYSPKTLLSNLKWGAFLKGEARYGRWGLLGDGMFVDLSTTTDTPGPLYKSASISVQQGLAQFALAYRVWEDYRGFVDLYVGARYNYFGLKLNGDLDNAGINDVADTASQTITEHIVSTTEDFVSQRADLVSQQTAARVTELQAAAQPQLAALQRQINQAIRNGKTAAIGQLQAQQEQLTAQVQTGVNVAQQRLDALQVQAQQQIRDIVTKKLVRRWVRGSSDIRGLDVRSLERLRARREFVALVQATARQQAAIAKQAVTQQINAQLVSLAQQRVTTAQQVLEKSLRQGTQQDKAAARRLVAAANSQLAAAQARKSSVGENIAALDSAVKKAQKRLSNKIAGELEDALPTDASSSVWWVDPIVGIRAQVNLTRWLFLATQCDAGGFGAGSQIAWNLNASVGVNWTRNLFTEIGYRYYYVDYAKNGLIYDVAEAGVFLGLGVKF